MTISSSAENSLCVDGLGIRPRKGAFFCSIKSRSLQLFSQDRGELVDLSGTAALELGDWYVLLAGPEAGEARLK